MKILSLIKSCDSLGEGINFSINKQSSLQTVTGGSLKILICILYACLFYSFGYDFIFKKNPNVYSQMKSFETKTVPKINFTVDDFIFGFRMENLYGKPINYEEYLYARTVFTLTYYNKTSESYIESDFELDVVSCNKFPKILKKIPNIYYNMSNFKCPDIRKLNNMTMELGGYWDDTELSFLRVELDYCKDRDRKICKKESDLIQKFKQEDEVFISIIYPRIIFNADNYENPFEYQLANHFNTLSVGSAYRDELFLGYNLLNQDAGIIFDSSKDIMEISGMKVKSRNSIIIRDANGNLMRSETSLYMMFLYFGREYVYHTRKYMKFQELLANVGSFMELVLFILGLLYKSYNKFRLDAYLFNRLVFLKGDFKDDLINKINLQHAQIELNDKKVIKKPRIHNNAININEPLKREDNTISINAIKSDNKLIKNTKFIRSDTDYKIKNLFNYAKSKLPPPKDRKLNSFEIDNISERTVNSNISSIRMLKLQKQTKNKNQVKIDSKSMTKSNSNSRNPQNKQILINLKSNRIENLLTRIQLNKNNNAFNFVNFLINSVNNLCIRKDKDYQVNLYEYLDKYSEKIYDEFEVFYYLKHVRNLNLINNILLENEQIHVLDILSKKFSSVALYNFNKDKNEDNSFAEQNLKLSIENLLNVKSIHNKRMMHLISKYDN